VPAIEGFQDFAIRRGGLQVFPQLRVTEAETARAEPMTSGLDELDRLLGAGLAWGSTTLFVGPAGGGKSTIAAQFVTALREDARASVYLFEERRGTFIARCDALGMRMSSRIRSGHITVTQIEPGDVSPGEFSHRVRAAVDTGRAQVVMIDSVNGYLNAIPQSDAPLVRLHELLSYLNATGVATLIVVAQHGVIGTMMTTPISAISPIASSCCASSRQAAPYGKRFPWSPSASVRP
jgi:circadian clock protein KaiC